MPQLVKGGKYIFGLSQIYEDFQINIPPEALEEYKLKNEEAVILISGSKTSGGFSICSISKLKDSKLSVLLDLLQFNDHKGTFRIPENEVVHFKRRIVCRIRLEKNGSFYLCHKLVEYLRLGNCRKIVVARGSGLGLGFISKGPIFNEALKHHELRLF
jgi:hypothetical protein